jgi:hypothetical protein
MGGWSMPPEVGISCEHFSGTVKKQGYVFTNDQKTRQDLNDQASRTLIPSRPQRVMKS